ncbi:MAG: hypothetical protein FWG83_06310, partial [Oscillospiraceae bacterium]|nr:hypothetical protein [Oscillospiraceae bacterium]
DRLKLRSMVVGENGDTVYIASEEAAIRIIQPSLDRVWSPKGGEPVILFNSELTQKIPTEFSPQG